jgi:uncharacterized protein (TIGR03086 family)
VTAENLQRAFRNTRAVVVNVEPAQFHDATPCASWDVHALLKHMLGVPYFFATGLRTGTAALDDRDFAAGDFKATYDDGIAQALAAARVPGALDRNVQLPFGMLPAHVWINIVTTDVFIHGWDLAKATGQDADIDPELATQLLEAARALMQPQFRGADTTAPFGPEQPAPANASAADQLAAFLGRHA